MNQIRTGNEGVKVNDVFISSWGYEQTNIQYFQVVRIAGKTMIEVREIEKESIDNPHYMCATVKPKLNCFKNEKTIKRKVQHYSRHPLIELTPYANASLLEKEGDDYPTAEQSSYY